MPRRRCVGCGRIAPKLELVRIAVTRGEDRGSARAVLDPLGTMGGRGAYLCLGADPGRPAAECLALATRRGAVARALRAPTATASELVESVSP